MKIDDIISRWSRILCLVSARRVYSSLFINKCVVNRFELLIGQCFFLSVFIKKKEKYLKKYVHLYTLSRLFSMLFLIKRIKTKFYIFPFYSFYFCTWPTNYTVAFPVHLFLVIRHPLMSNSCNPLVDVKILYYDYSL